VKARPGVEVQPPRPAGLQQQQQQQQQQHYYIGEEEYSGNEGGKADGEEYYIRSANTVGKHMAAARCEEKCETKAGGKLAAVREVKDKYVGPGKFAAAARQLDCHMATAIASECALSQAIIVEMRLLELYVQHDAARGTAAAVAIAAAIGEAELELLEIELAHPAMLDDDEVKSTAVVGKPRRRRRPG
jgi:hypothetical protein